MLKQISIVSHSLLWMLAILKHSIHWQGVMMMKIPRYQAKFGDQAGIIFPSRQGSCLDRANHNHAISNGTARLTLENNNNNDLAPLCRSLAGNVSASSGKLAT